MVATSDVTRNRTVLRRGAVRKVEEHFVEVTPSPSFWRIVAFDDGMSRRVKMFGGVAVGRLIAAAHVAAGPAQAQVHPARTRLQAIFATARTRHDTLNTVQVRAGILHRRSSPVLCGR